MKHTHTEGLRSILKSRFARGAVPLMAALFACALAAPAAHASGPINNFTTLAVSNYWTPTTATDGEYLASNGDNWSAGHAPLESEDVVFDGNISTTNCAWDAAATHKVASWTQTNGYTGTVTLKTVYPGKGDFQCLTVTGPMAVMSGTITHPQSLKSTSETWLTGAQIQEEEVYRLCLVVGGTLTVGASGAIDVKDKGHYQALKRDCYGAHAVGYSSLGGAAAYGSPKEPIDIGMGCNGYQWAWVSYPGSGAIRITAENVVVNGSICASAGTVNYGGHRRFSAAAGSIWIDADSITGSGSITAVAVTPKDVASNGRGSGGSIALWTKTPVSLGSPFVSAGAASSGLNAPGTVYLHDQNMDKGVLIIDGMRSGNPLDYRACVYVTTDGDWTFDEVRLQNYGALAVPVGTTLVLPGGWASITSTNAVSATNYGVLRYEGGTIDVGTVANVVLSGRWMLTPWTNLTLNANVTVKDGAAIGVPAMAVVYDTSTTGVLPDFVSCNLSVNGDLTVESTGSVLAKSCGMRKNRSDSNNGVLGFHSHGGRSLRWGKTSNLFYEAYDSVFSPGLPGCTVPYPDGQTAGAAGGAVRLSVSGTLTLNGSANANGLPESHNGAGNASGGAGGAIDITAGRLVGVGSIAANGGCYLWQRGPGGRVAVKLTSSGADFSSFSGTIEASGRARNDGYKGPGDASAGTVYLQTAAEGDKAGTICIGQSLAESYYGTDGVSGNTNTTEMVSLGYGGDAIADYRKVKYIVRDYGRAAVNADMKAASIEIADANSSLDLEGHTLTVKSAKVNGVKLSPGTYTAASLVDYLVDSGVGGALVVSGGGFRLSLR